MYKISAQDREIRSNLANSVKDGCCFSIMVGASETYFAALILALGFSQVSSAWIATLPLLAGAILQMISPYGVRKFRSYSRWVLLTASIQGLSFIIFAIAAFTQSFPEWMLYLGASIYWGAGMATSPAWNVWIGALIPEKIRTEFFSHRNRLIYICTLLGLILSGLILEYGKKNQSEMLAFTIIFILGAIMRLASVYFLSRQSEPPLIAEKMQIMTFAETFRRILRNPYGKILIYLFFLQIAVQVSSGFFNPYMLSQLRLPYWSYMVLLGTIVLAKALSMPLISFLIKKFGLRTSLVIASLGISPIPIVWLFSDKFISLVALQAFAGVAWAMHELAAFLILFSEIPSSDRTSVLTEFNLFNTLGIVGGSIAGGCLFQYLGHNQNAYVAIFLLSAGLRFACIFLIPNAVHPIIKVRKELFSLLVRVRPTSGGILRPIITNSKNKSPE